MPAWFVERNEGEHVDVVFEMSGAPSAIGDAFRIVATADTSSSSESGATVEVDVAESLIFKN